MRVKAYFWFDRFFTKENSNYKRSTVILRPLLENTVARSAAGNLGRSRSHDLKNVYLFFKTHRTLS
jgi:hypothetical protein